ncbi:ty3-gypsy retrotransposon protein [Cucumis melo var. makuwa]|uniref:Ty3-gypsy retrotransposon protein n=1 Tax=Cucumis melo var. makuwa TaxID=1194695 RepID=A0A5A7T154_CUCMM|nr:ty3-gypsy retrotransposon protein [Cucumis melo var. makuwa]TYK30454.1 ty3-gypsy retrotransposon protein [Cucumis melo var. makuwa]
MALKKVASKSSVTSDAYTGPITSSRSKGITQEQDQGSNVAQSILKQLMESPKAEIAAMAEMERKVNFLMKVMKERDHEITAWREQMRTRETTESSQTLVVKATDKGKNVDMIANSIRAQYGGPPQTSFMYSKPYTKRIDNLRMPLEIKRRSTSQEIRSKLKGNAFEWYIDLEPEVIDSWEQMEIEFLNRFYSTRRVVSMMELTNTKQRKEEPVIDYINQCRALSLDCKDKLTELSTLEMCTQEQVEKVDNPNYCKYHRVISHPVEKCFLLKELILKLVRENKIELDIDEVAQTNHVAVKMTSKVRSSMLLYDQRESLIQFGTFKPILVGFQQKIMTTNSQNKEEPIEDDDKEWIVVARQKGRQTNSIQTKSHFHQKHSKGSISHKNKEKRNKNMSKPRPIKGKDKDFFRPRRLITLTEFFPRSFLEDHPKEILEVTACHTVNIVEVDNNYVSSKEVNNSNEIKQRTSVFDRIKPSTTRYSIFQILTSFVFLKKLHRCFFKFKFKGFKLHRCSREDLYLHPLTCVAVEKLVISNILHREGRHLKYVVAEKVAISNMLQPRRSSSQICCSKKIFISNRLHQEDDHLKHVTAEEVIASNMLHPRRPSSQICCSREGRCLKYVVAEKVVVSNMFSREGRRLKYVVAEKVIVSNMLQSRRSTSSSSCGASNHHLRRARSSSSMKNDAGDHHLQ